MLTISSGHSAAYLTDAVATGRESYYTGAVAAGEPPGRWYGAGAERLGLVGVVDAQDMTALYEHFVDPRDPGFRDPEAWAEAQTLGHRGRLYISEEELYAAALNAEPDASAERRAELQLQAGKRARRNVAFLDATFSVPKSITVIHAAFESQEVLARRGGDDDTAEAWAAHRRAVEDAIWAGNRAALDYLAQRAGYSRVGHHGGAAGRFIDAHGFVVASFFQHDSRDHDPQLHIHNAILNRVEGSDGQWRTIDGRALYAHRGAAAAVGERTTEAHLARSLGIRFATRPDGKAREVLGVAPEVVALFSARRHAITAKTTELLKAFERRFDRKPNALELDRLQRQATFATRRAKAHGGESVEQRLGRWDAELRAEVAGGLARVAHDVLASAEARVNPSAWTPAAVIEAALADIQGKKAGWTRPDLTRAISDALPDSLGALDGAAVTTLLDGLADQALLLAVPLDADRPATRELPTELRLADGTSAYEAPGRRLYATPDHLHTERLLAASTADLSAARLSPAEARTFVHRLAESGVELAADQLAAVHGVLTSGGRVECLVGPAGTGKSFTVGTIAHAWEAHGHAVVGLASSQMATEVLVDEGIAAVNITRWLAAQDRLERATPAGVSPEDERYRLEAGDLVVIDESAMTSTPDIAAVHARVLAADAKLLLTGDHRQLAAVGAGGAMDLIAGVGGRYELREARRFRQSWEAAASLKLRAGELTALDDYHKHGRLLDCGTLASAEASAARAWLADHLSGRRSVLLVDTNQSVIRLNAAVRAELVRLSRVDEVGVRLGRDGNVVGVGDLVEARANAWNLAGYLGNRRGPINREVLRVVELHQDGPIRVIGEASGEVMTLPREYVAAHVTLGYAATVHAAQGRTVDTAHIVVGPATSAAAIYVGMTRGRESNTAHVTTVSAPTDAADGTARHAVRRNPRAVLATALDGDDRPGSALAHATRSQQDARSIRTAGELLIDAIGIATAGRVSTWLDRLVDDGYLTQRQRDALALEDGAATLTRLLRRAELAGHDPELVLRDAVAERGLSDARQLSNVLHHRICRSARFDPCVQTLRELVPLVEDQAWLTYLTRLAGEADARVAQLADTTEQQLPAWAVDALGLPSTADDARQEWLRRAGVVAAYRELTGLDDAAIALGPPPKPGQTEMSACWRAAWRALGRDEAAREEAEMSNGQLRLRIRAWEREQAWAPRYVANELAGTTQIAAQQRNLAVLRYAEAEVAGGADRERRRQEAEQATALADLLDARCAELSDADAARACWYAHTASTRAAAERAAAELAGRGTDCDGPSVTAEEWVAAQSAVGRLLDRDRVIGAESDFADHELQRRADLATLGGAVPAPVVAEQAAPIELPATSEDVVRVPSAEETARIVARARAALVEIEIRRVREDAQAAEEHRAAQLARWAGDDRAATRHDRHVLERT